MTTLKIIDIEGIGPSYAEKLVSIGIKNSDDLLKKGKTPQGRKEISQQSEISDKLILKWINMADLIRIKGVGEEYSELLEVSGVDTVIELSHRNAENLHEKMQKVNDQKKLVRRPPTLNEVENWIIQAKDLPRMIEYSSSSPSSTTTELDSDESLPDLEDRIDALQVKLSHLSAKLETGQTQIKPAETTPQPSTPDIVETTKPKDVLPKGFESKTDSIQSPKPSRGTLPKGF